MDKKYAEFVGVDNLHVSVITEDSESAYVAEAPWYLAPAAEVAGEPEVDNTTTYYDNVPANTYVTEGPTVLTLVVSGVPADKAARLLGKYYDAATGRVVDNGKPNPPDCALSFRYDKGKSDYRYYQYLKGTFSGGAEEATSKTGSVEVKTYTLTYTAITTTYKWTVDGVSQPLKRIFGDTTDTVFDPTSWFTQVQTPTTVGAPSAIALASSDPEDAEIDVAKASNLTLTFNNAIASYAITVINTSTLAVIACAITLDATKKILTINPNSDLAGSTEYAIIASKVTDVFGQSLKDTIINFTTIA